MNMDLLVGIALVVIGFTASAFLVRRDMIRQKSERERDWTRP